MAGTRQQGKVRGRPAHQRNSVVDLLRERIVNGCYRPDQRLPDRAELQAELGAASATIQAAIHQLAKEGFLRASRGHGTFVASHPPHLHRYAVVYAEEPGSPKPWSRMFVALAAACQELEHHSASRFVHYYGVAHPDPHAEGYSNLLADLRAKRLAGIIFAALTVDIANSAVGFGSPLPKVAINLEATLPGLPRVVVDRPDWMRQATNLAASLGSRKVGLLAPVLMHMGPTGLEEFRHLFTTNLARLGLETRPYWQLGCPVYTPYVFADWLQILLRLPPEDRPDTLLIADDNLVEALTPALAGADAPRVIAHCNFPSLPTPAAPVDFVGFNLHDLLAKCLHSLEQQKAGLPVDDITGLPAIVNPANGKHES